MTDIDMAAARRILARATQLQGELWDAIGELEDVIGVSVDSMADLSGYTVESLIEEAGEEGEA